jgi:hypothetical protein
MGDTFIISGLREKRSAVAGRIVDLRREVETLKADLFHIDAVLRLYDVEPEEIPTKGRVSSRSVYFARNEVSRRCRDMLRERGTLKADDLTVQAMRDKGLDPEANRKTRTDFSRRFLVTLHDLRKAGAVEKVSAGRGGVIWRLKGISQDRLA